MSTLLRAAHSVLFPVSNSIDLSDDVLRCLDQGGRSVLLGETAEEYRSGTMSPERAAYETPARWQATIQRATDRAGALLVALDEDVSAVHRLHGLTAALPTLEAAQAMADAAFEQAVYQVAASAKALGVTLLLSPTADVVVGANPWLAGRTLGHDIAGVSRLVQAYVRAATAAGIGSTLKHFPGHPTLSGLPAVEAAHVRGDMQSLRHYLAPFRAGIAAGANAVMMSPAIFDALQPPTAGPLSRQLMELLRGELQFKGLVMTCDLDHKSTLGSCSVGDTAVASLAAGADLLLLSPVAVPSIPAIARAIAEAVASGALPEERLLAASAAVHATCERLNTSQPNSSK